MITPVNKIVVRYDEETISPEIIKAVDEIFPENMVEINPSLEE